MAILLGLMAYVSLQLVIGAVVATRVHSNEDYVLAGRRLGYGLGTFTIFATWFGAESCIGSAGKAYERGLVAGEVDPFGYTLCLLVMGIFYAARFWRARFLTMADLFRDRFSVGIERLAVLILVPTSVIWSAAQLRAFGQVLAAAANIDIVAGITIALVVTVIYTVMGGMWADAITDLIQGGALILGLIILTVVVFVNHGADVVEQVAPDRWRLFPANEQRAWYGVLNDWLVPILNAVVAQELVARTLASKSARIARNNCFLAAGLYLLVGLMPLTLGIVGPTLLPNLQDPEQILPTLARTYLPTFLYVIFAGAIISALLSTIDSALLVSAALVANNLVPLRSSSSDAAKLRWSRTWVVLLGVASYLVTFSSDSVFDLVMVASSLGASGLFIVITFGLFTRIGGPWSATGAIIVGLGLYLLGEHLEWEAPFLLSVLAAAAVYLAVASLEPRGPAVRLGPAT